MSLSETSDVRPLRSDAYAEPSMAGAGDYFELMKPRVMSLVVFTALVGMVVAPVHVNPVIGFFALVCIAVGAGAAGALNMWYDADIDQLMKRTSTRPIPAGRVLPREALAFGVALSVGSVVFLGLMVNVLAAALLAFTIFFYAVIYTMWLKPTTPQNIVIGGAAGAFPPMIGWAVATGGIGFESVLLFLIIFIWTPPHFWALALMIKEHYAAANVPMLPVAKGDEETTRQIVRYSWVMLALTLVPVAFGVFGWVYGALALLLGAIFMVYAVKLRRNPIRERAVSLFHYSMLYLALLFLAMAVDRHL